MPIMYTLKEWKRKDGRDALTIPPGRAINIELRSEMEEGLRTKSLTRDKALADRLRRKKVVLPKKAAESDSIVTSVAALAKVLGEPLSAARGRYKTFARRLGAGATPAQVVYAVRKHYKALSAKELAAEVTNLLKVPLEEAEAMLASFSTQYKVPQATILDWLEFAVENGAGEDSLPIPKVLDRLSAIIGGRVATPAQAKATLVAEIRAARRDSSDAVGEIVLESQVRVKDEKSEFYGKEGTVVAQAKDGALRVALKEDPTGKKSRLFLKEQLDVV